MPNADEVCDVAGDFSQSEYNAAVDSIFTTVIKMKFIDVNNIMPRSACACIPIIGKIIGSNDLAEIVCLYASIPEYALIAKFLLNNKVSVNVDGVNLTLIDSMYIPVAMRYYIRSKMSTFGIIGLVDRDNKEYMRDVLSTSKLPQDILVSLAPGYAVMSARIDKILDSTRNRHAHP